MKVSASWIALAGTALLLSTPTLAETPPPPMSDAELMAQALGDKAPVKNPKKTDGGDDDCE